MQYINYQTHIIYSGDRAHWRDIPATSERPSSYHRPIIKDGEHTGWEFDIESARESASLTRSQFKLALLDKGYLQDVRDFVETTSDERIKILWEDSDSFHRLDSDLLNMTNEMGYTDEQLDDLFGVE